MLPGKATVKSTGASSKGLSIVFTNAQTKQKITLVHASGKTVIKWLSGIRPPWAGSALGRPSHRPPDGGTGARGALRGYCVTFQKWT